MDEGFLNNVTGVLKNTLDTNIDVTEDKQVVVGEVPGLDNEVNVTLDLSKVSAYVETISGEDVGSLLVDYVGALKVKGSGTFSRVIEDISVPFTPTAETSAAGVDGNIEISFLSVGQDSSDIDGFVYGQAQFQIKVPLS